MAMSSGSEAGKSTDARVKVQDARTAHQRHDQDQQRDQDQSQVPRELHAPIVAERSHAGR